MPNSGSHRRPPRVAGIRRPTTPAPAQAASTPDPNTPDDDTATDKPKGTLSKRNILLIGAGIAVLVFIWLVSFLSRAATDYRYMRTDISCMSKFHDGTKCDSLGLAASSETSSNTAWLVILIIICVTLTIVGRRMLKNPDKWLVWGVTTNLFKVVWLVLTVFTAVYFLIWAINMLV